MSKIKLCPECGVPRGVIKHNVWLPNGTILEDNHPDHRVVFIERDSLMDTFTGIESTLGISIEHIITESQRRSTYDSVDRALPAPLKLALRRMGTRLMSRYLVHVGTLNGKGDIELISYRRRRGQDDYVKIRIREPFSLPHFSGNFSGAMEAGDGREISITHEEIAPDEYELTAHISRNPVALKERLQRKDPHYKPGDIELPRCGTCGGPTIISEYAWRLDRGVIENKKSGRRMIIISTATQDAIMDELIKEIGDPIIQAVVEVQRNLVASGFFSGEEIRGVEDFRTQFAYRGLGNLAEIDFGQDHLRIRVENPCFHAMVAGLTQGLYEGASGTKSHMEWEASEDGDLIVEVTLDK
jgi:uncharacterized protein (DUF736 family)